MPGWLSKQTHGAPLLPAGPSRRTLEPSAQTQWGRWCTAPCYERVSGWQGSRAQLQCPEVQGKLGQRWHTTAHGSPMAPPGWWPSPTLISSPMLSGLCNPTGHRVPAAVAEDSPEAAAHGVAKGHRGPALGFAGRASSPRWTATSGNPPWGGGRLATCLRFLK